MAEARLPARAALPRLEAGPSASQSPQQRQASPQHQGCRRRQHLASHQNRRPSGLRLASLGLHLLPIRLEKLLHLRHLHLGEGLPACHLRQLEAELSDALGRAHQQAAHQRNLQHLHLQPAAHLQRSAVLHRRQSHPLQRPRFLREGRRNRQELLHLPSACPVAGHQLQGRAKEKLRLYLEPLAGPRLAAARPRPDPLPLCRVRGVLDLAWRPAGGGPGGARPSAALGSKAPASPSPSPSL